MKSFNIKSISIIILAVAVFACKPSDEKMVKKLNRKIAKSQEKVEKFQNRITGFEQALREFEQKALLADKEVDNKNVEKTRKKIEKLKKELAGLEETVANGGNSEAEEVEESKAVTIVEAKKETFEKYIEVQGAVTSKDMVMVAANSGGVLSSVSVVEGQYVSKGQNIAVVNSDVLQSSIAEVENQLVLANTIFEKQKRLWVDQQIGTEVAYLQAKNNKEALEKQLQTLQIRLGDATVQSTINGVVDEVFAFQGEMTGPGRPIARIVNLNNVQVEAEVPEKFIGKINRGDKVQVYFQSLDLTKTAKIRAVSQTLNPGNRTFKIELDLPNADKKLKPYLLATLKLKEYEAKDQLIIPTKLIQKGSKGDYVYALADGVVTKKWIKINHSYGGSTEVTEGLVEGDELINLGFKDVLEGETVEVKTLEQ